MVIKSRRQKKNLEIVRLCNSRKKREIEELNLVGDWLYYTEQDFIEDKAALKRLNIENEQSETLYMMGGNPTSYL